MAGRLRASALGVGLLNFFDLVAAEGLDVARLGLVHGLHGFGKFADFRRQERAFGSAQRHALRFVGQFVQLVARRRAETDPFAVFVGPVGRRSGKHLARFAGLCRLGGLRRERRGLRGRRLIRKRATAFVDPEFRRPRRLVRAGLVAGGFILRRSALRHRDRLGQRGRQGHAVVVAALLRGVPESLRLALARWAIAYRDAVVIRVYLAEGQKPVSIPSVIDKGRL